MYLASKSAIPVPLAHAKGRDIESLAQASEIRTLQWKNLSLILLHVIYSFFLMLPQSCSTCVYIIVLHDLEMCTVEAPIPFCGPTHLQMVYTFCRSFTCFYINLTVRNILPPRKLYNAFLLLGISCNRLHASWICST